MPSLAFMQPARSGCVIVKHDAANLGIRPVALVGVGVKRLPTDAIGTATVTFKGVPAGSEIRVQYPGAIDAAGIESCAADQVLTWNAYAPGNPNNTVRIVIIDMEHRIKEFNYETTGAGAQSIPIQPEADRWFLNP